jgi:hypothetical protein
MKKYIIFAVVIFAITNFAYSQNAYKMINQVHTLIGIGKTPLQARINASGSSGRILGERASQISENIYIFKKQVLIPNVQPIFSRSSNYRK